MPELNTGAKNLTDIKPPITVQFYSVQANNYEIRYADHQGHRHLIVPVVMMVEGVHAGSHGPLLHLEEELGRFPEAWNGIPITINHPEFNGSFVAANDPGIIDAQTVGRVYHTRMESGKLKSEAWIDEEKIKQISPLALAYIRNKRPLEVSVGVFTDDEMSAGSWNGEEYIAIARNHRPDHLALLPGGTGACSWADGAGIRANMKGEGGEDAVDLKLLASLLAQEGRVVTMADGQGWKSVMESIQTKLNTMDTDTRLYYLQEVYDDAFVFEIRGPEGLVGLFQRGYITDENGSVEFTGEPEKVVRKVDYIKANEDASTMKRTKNNKGGRKNMTEKIDKILALEKSPFTEDDRSTLEAMDEKVLDKLLAMRLPEAEPKVVTKEVDAEEVRAFMAKVSDPQKFLSFLPQEFRGSVEHGLRLFSAHKQGLISHILTNQASKDAWTKEELEQMDPTTLAKLADSIKERADYSGQGGSNLHAYEEEALLPPGVKVQ